jgi:hypothetical protein
VTATEEVVTQHKEAELSTGLVIKDSKTKYMKIDRNITNLKQDLTMDEQVFEGVQNFRYLGTVINYKLHIISEEMKSRQQTFL